MTSTRKPRVVVVGAGFGGLFAAKGLAKAEVDVILVDRNNYHTFIPLLYQVASAELLPEEIAYPVRTIARRQRNLRFILAEVIGVDLDAKVVKTTREELPYDFLILAAGSVTNFFGLESVERHAFGIKDLPESVALRNHILERFEQASHEEDPEKRKALLTFVIVGGGPTGVEFSATLSELIRGTLRKDYPDLSLDEMKVYLLEATDRLLPSVKPELGAYAAEILRKKGVIVQLGAMVTGATAERVELRDAPAIPTHTLVWTAGVRASELADQLGVARGRAGRIVVTDELHLPGRPEVYVVGDMAYVEQEGRPVPQVAPAAIQQAEVAAANIVRQLRGEPLAPFRYEDKGTMVTIGRSAGVAAIGRWSIKGFVAWVAWLAVHIIRLIGFRNRLYVLSSWAWSYIFQDRIRLIIKARGHHPPDEGPPSEQQRADGVSSTEQRLPDEPSTERLHTDGAPSTEQLEPDEPSSEGLQPNGALSSDQRQPDEVPSSVHPDA